MVRRFSASGVLTITTDLGHKGPFAALMKGVILRRLPEARIVDITHDISVHWGAEAGFWLARSYAYFPLGTVHVAVVDPGLGTGRDIIAAEKDGHVFVAPDNGLLAGFVDVASDRVHRFDLESLRLRFGLDLPSATFHGRDIFAPIAAEFAAGHCQVEEVGPAATDLIPSLVDAPERHGNRVDGIVIAVDAFGNLITNIPGPLLEGMEAPIARAGGHSIELHRSYGEMKPGDYLALVNSFGVLEIARAEQSAADGLGLERGAPVSVLAR